MRNLFYLGDNGKPDLAWQLSHPFLLCDLHPMHFIYYIFDAEIGPLNIMLFTVQLGPIMSMLAVTAVLAAACYAIVWLRRRGIARMSARARDNWATILGVVAGLSAGTCAIVLARGNQHWRVRLGLNLQRCIGIGAAVASATSAVASMSTSWRNTPVRSLLRLMLRPLFVLLLLWLYLPILGMIGANMNDYGPPESTDPQVDGCFGLLSKHRGDAPVRCPRILIAVMTRASGEADRIDYRKQCRYKTPYKFFVGVPDAAAYDPMASAPHDYGGIPQNTAIARKLLDETARHDDVVVLPYRDNYRDLAFKTLGAMRYARDHGFDYMVKTDDENCVDARGVTIQALRPRPAEATELYLGRKTHGFYRAPVSAAQGTSAWGPNIVGADGTQTPYQSGWFWLISKRLVQNIAGSKWARSILWLAYGNSSEDISLARWVLFAQADGVGTTWRNSTGMLYNRILRYPLRRCGWRVSPWLVGLSFALLVYACASKCGSDHRTEHNFPPHERNAAPKRRKRIRRWRRVAGLFVFVQAVALLAYHRVSYTPQDQHRAPDPNEAAISASSTTESDPRILVAVMSTPADGHQRAVFRKICTVGIRGLTYRFFTGVPDTEATDPHWHEQGHIAPPHDIQVGRTLIQEVDNHTDIEVLAYRDTRRDVSLKIMGAMRYAWNEGFHFVVMTDDRFCVDENALKAVLQQKRQRGTELFLRSQGVWAVSRRLIGAIVSEHNWAYSLLSPLTMPAAVAPVVPALSPGPPKTSVTHFLQLITEMAKTKANLRLQFRSYAKGLMRPAVAA